MESRRFRLLTWNLQGSHGVDVDAVAGVIAEVAPDVVALQEVQRRQHRRLAAALGGAASHWIFKNLSLPRPHEGLAILTRHRIVDARTLLLRRSLTLRWPRRVALVARIAVNGDRGEAGYGVDLVNTHLSPHDEGDARRAEIDLIVADAAAHGRAPLVVGDLNDLPGDAAPAALRAHGWRDSWSGDGGATNWTAGARAGRPPTQRLDYVFVPAGWQVERTWVVAEPARHDWFATLSDHLPLCAELLPPASSDAEAAR